MRRITLLSLLSLFTFGSAQAGHWTMANSPVMINGNTMLADYGQTLTIDPGVVVIMTGPYQLSCRGTIRSLGTQEAPVTFRIQDTTGWSNDAIPAGGWRGIKFDNTGANTGNDLFQWTNISDMKGYGISASRKVTFTNCNIFHNRATNPNVNFGGAIMTFEPGAHGIVMDRTNVYNNYVHHNVIWLAQGGLTTPNVISNSHFHHNYNGNVVHSTLANLDIKDCEFDNNHTNGIGASAINIEGKVVNILRNKIHHNYSDAVATVHASMGKVLLDGNIVCNNVQDGSYSCGYTDGGSGMHLAHNNGGVWDSTEYIVRNNIIANNYSNYVGAGIYIYSCKIWISNNTIVNNKSKYMGAAVHTFGAVQARFRNNIIRGNRSEYIGDDTTVQIKIAGGTYLAFNHNYLDRPLYKDIIKQMALPMVPYTGDTTKNYIGGNPGFINPTMGANATENTLAANFGITAASPCINRGDSVGARLGAVDYAQAPRFNGKLDIGAYERTGPVGIGNAVVAGNEQSLTAWPNPAKDNVNLILPDEGGMITIYSMTGAAILEKAVSGTSASVSLQGITPGFYTIRWTGKNTSAAARIRVD